MYKKNLFYFVKLILIREKAFYPSLSIKLTYEMNDLSYVEVKNYGENFKKNLLIPLDVLITDDSEYGRFSIA